MLWKYCCAAQQIQIYWPESSNPVWSISVVYRIVFTHKLRCNIFVKFDQHWQKYVPKYVPSVAE